MQSRMKVFIGSSSDAVPYAHVIQDLIFEAGGPIVEVEAPEAEYIESLLEMAPSVHAALWLSSGDETIEEYGMAVKACGLERTALATLGPVALPGDLSANHIVLVPAEDLEEFRERNRIHVLSWLDTVLRLPRPTMTSTLRVRPARKRKPALSGRRQERRPAKVRRKDH